MFDVNGNTLQAAYSLLRTLESIIVPPEKKATAKAAIVTLKREIRAYTNRPASDSCIIKEYGIDGYVELYRFPDSLDDASKDEAESYFDSTRREYYTPQRLRLHRAAVHELAQAVSPSWPLVRLSFHQL